MTEKQAWRTIAEAYATLRSERPNVQWKLTRYGICLALVELERTKTITDNMYDRMDDKIWAEIDALRLSGLAYHPVFCTYHSVNDKLRADYCYLQYYMLGGRDV